MNTFLTRNDNKPIVSNIIGNKIYFDDDYLHGGASMGERLTCEITRARRI
jgi:hypothetical protein